MSEIDISNKVPDISQLKNDLIQMFNDHAYRAVLEYVIFGPEGWLERGLISPHKEGMAFWEAIQKSVTIQDESWGPGTVRVVAICPMNMLDLAEKWIDGMLEVLEPVLESHPHFKGVYGFVTKPKMVVTVPSVAVINLVFPFNDQGIETMREVEHQFYN
jgi:hypothetical protein